MKEEYADYDAIAESLTNSMMQLMIFFGACPHEYKQIKRIKIESLSLKSEDLPDGLEEYLSSPTLIVIYKCKHCKKIKENHYMEVNKH